jgi:hypothetical protein
VRLIISVTYFEPLLSIGNAITSTSVRTIAIAAWLAPGACLDLAPISPLARPVVRIAAVLTTPPGPVPRQRAPQQRLAVVECSDSEDGRDPKRSNTGPEDPWIRSDASACAAGSWVPPSVFEVAVGFALGDCLDLGPIAALSAAVGRVAVLGSAQLRTAELYVALARHAFQPMVLGHVEERQARCRRLRELIM